MATPGRRILASAVLFFLAACGGGDGGGGEAAGEADDGAGEVNVYSHRHYETDQQLFDRFTERTGIAVNVVTASADELITRLESEGEATPADVLITVDAGRLHRAKERGLLQAVESDVLEANVPEHLRDRDRQWWGLTRRARVFVYAPDRVDATELSTYADLADPRWEGRVLIRSSTNVYNQSLLASIIAHEGEEAAESWAEGVEGNMARAPSGGDTDQIMGVAAGAGDVAVANTYYLARLAASEDSEEQRVAEAVEVLFPDHDGRGTHVNVSGAGVTRHAGNVENAVALLEFLTGDEAQELFASANHEYPVKAGVAWSPTLEGWGEFRADTLDLTVLGELNDEAVRIFDRVG
ncbi:MAG: Fe(3+) ABC transporter substrate-binding protein, partial [Longimicrobiales bacterium]